MLYNIETKVIKTALLPRMLNARAAGYILGLHRVIEVSGKFQARTIAVHSSFVGRLARCLDTGPGLQAPDLRHLCAR